MKKNLCIAAACVFALSPLFLSAQQGGVDVGMPGNLSEAGLKKLVDNPAVLSSKVEELPDDANKKSWFRLFCDTQTATAVPIGSIYAALNDFGSYAKNFSGVKSVKIIRTNAEGSVVEASAGRFGVNSRYVYLQTEPVKADDEHLVVRISIDTEGDGTMKNMDTRYYLKAVTIDGKPYTYLRCYDITDYMSQMWGQYTIMKSKNEGSHKDGLTDLINAAVKR
ncbi:MAG: hypothetical protein LBS82_06700 [Spirochaetaceae bacterium]|jgi:hypothetical protein|nr:hypothetical protein [Spirochaetaceae bacterium]